MIGPLRQPFFRIHLCPSGSDEQSLPLSREGLEEETGAAFESEIREVLGRLSREGGFLVLEGGTVSAEVIPLDRAFAPDQVTAVTSRLRDARASRGRLDSDGRWVRFDDLAHALESVWPATNPQDDRRVRAVQSLDRVGQSVSGGQLPVLPLAACGDSGGPLLDLLIDVTVDTLFSPRSFLRA